MYNDILDGHEATCDLAALNFAQGICADWSTMNWDKLPAHSRFIDSVNGINVYYDYAADYYFFTETEDKDK